LNISATGEEIDEMIDLADKQNSKQVFFEDFKEMAKGKILSPIGLAFPPTLAILENKNINFSNMPAR